MCYAYIVFVFMNDPAGIDLIRNYVGHKIKMAQRVWVVCTGNLWRELHFEMFTMKNAGFDSGEIY